MRSCSISGSLASIGRAPQLTLYLLYLSLYLLYFALTDYRTVASARVARSCAAVQVVVLFVLF
jgi:hypothetical protein